MTSNELGPVRATVQNTAAPESMKRTLLGAVTIELQKPRSSDSTVSVTLGNRQGEKTLEKGSSTITWEPEEAWEITTGSVLRVSLKFGGVLSFPWSRNKSSHEVEIDSDEILSESITRFNQSVAERGPDGMSVFERVIEDKGHKITMKFSILDEPRSQSTLSPRPQRGSQSGPYPEALPEIEDTSQPKSQPVTQLDPLHEQIANLPTEEVVIKRTRDRLGASVTYLENLLSIGDVIKDIHPCIGISIGLLSGVMKILEMEDEINQRIARLVISMSDIVVYVFDVEQFATIEQLKTVIEEANDLIRRTVGFFYKHKERGSFIRVFSAFSITGQEELEELEADFDRFRSVFDRGISVQTITTANNLSSQLEDLNKQFMELVRAEEDDKVLEVLNTMHQTRALRCLDGTRRDLIAFVQRFAVSALNILWIFGYPGSGKSTLAMHVADLFRIAHRLGIVVEFNRNTGVNAVLLWKTIAYALACEYPECRKVIVSKLKSRTANVANATSRDIFNQLVVEPLRQLTAPGSNVPHGRLPVIIIDALDECGGLEGSSWKARKDILECLADWAKLAPGVKLIVTSRTEQDIMQVFKNIPHTPLEISTGTSATETSTHDIALYLKHEFKQIATRNTISGDWPGDKIITDLTRRAEGVFIWATTVLDFIDDVNPDRQLKTILSGQFPAGNLYGLYRQILETSFRPTYDAKEFVHIVGATVVLQRQFTPTELMQLLGVEPSAIIDIRKGLRTVLDHGDTLQFRHQSFVHFLTNAPAQTNDSPTHDPIACPERFHIDITAAHGRACGSLFRVMNEGLRFNICQIPSSFMHNGTLRQNEDEDNNGSKSNSTNVYVVSEDTIGCVLSYACRFWGFHLSNTGSELNVGLVETFIREHFLSWVESLSGLRSLVDAVPSLTTFEQWLTSHHKQPSDLKVLVKDAITFVRYFADVIALSAPHVYISALAFAPKSSMIARLYAPKFKNIARVVVGQPDEWPARQTVIRRHSGSVRFVAFSPDGRRVVSCSDDETVQISDVDTSEIVAVPFKGHNRDVLCAVYSTDGKTVLSVSRDKTIRMWDAECGVIDEPVKHDIVTIGGIGECKLVMFSHNRKYIASVQRKDTMSDGRTVTHMISVHDVVTGRVVTGPIESHEEPINCVTFSPDDAYVASCSNDSTICVWSTQTGKLVTGPLKWDQGKVLSISYSHNGAFITSGGGDGTVVLWDVRGTPRQVRVYKAHTHWVLCVSFSSDDRRIVSGSADCTVLVLDVESGQVVAGPFQGHTNFVTSVTFSPDCKRIASCSQDSTVRIWDVEGDTESDRLFDGHRGDIRCIALSSDSKRIVSGSEDSTVRIWDSESGCSVGSPLNGHENVVYSAAYSPDNQRIVSISSDMTVRVWDVTHGEIMMLHYVQPHNLNKGLVNPLQPAHHEPIPQCRAHDSQWVTVVEFSHDGSRIASGSRDTTILVFNAKSLSRVFKPFRGHSATVTSLSFSSNDEVMASSSVDRCILVWHICTGKLLATFACTHANSPVVFVRFLNNDKNVVSCSEDAEVRVWEVDFERDRVDSHKKKSVPGMHLAFAFAGNLLVQSRGHRLAQSRLTVDTKRQLWSWSETKLFSEGHHHSDYITSVAISPDGETIASGSKDRSVRLWTRIPGTFEYKNKWTADPPHDSWVMCVTFSSNGHYVISGSLDGIIRVWDVETGERVAVPFPVDGQVLCVSTHGERVAWGTSGGMLQIQNLRLRRDQDTRGDDSHHARDDVPEDEPAGSDKGSLLGDSEDITSVLDRPDDSETRDREIKVRSLAVAYSNNGRYIASASLDGTDRLWNAETGDCIHVLQLGDRLQASIAFSPDDKFVVSSSSNGFQIWDIETGKLTIEPRGVSGVYSVTFSRDGKLVATVSVDGIHLWNATTGQLVLGPFKGHTRAVSVAFSPDDKLLVSGSWDCTVRIWDTKTGQTVRGPFKGHTGIVNSVVFSHDGKFVISGSEDKTIRIWSTERTHPAPSLFTDETEIDEDGWTRGEDGELLFWIPPRHRLSLHRPSNTRVIGPNETQLDFSNARWGKDWTQCYTP